MADAHFPTSSVCRCGPKELRADGKVLFYVIYLYLYVLTKMTSPALLVTTNAHHIHVTGNPEKRRKTKLAV